MGIYNRVGVNFNAFYLRCYNAIYNRFYRDQDLITEIGEDQTTVQKVSYEKDMFTAARPWAQKGAAITLPIGSTAPVVSTGDTVRLTSDYASNVDLQIENATGNVKTNSTPPHGS